MDIPEQLKPYKFVKLGVWDEYKKKGEGIKKFYPETQEELKKLVKKGWKPQGKQPQELEWQTKNNYSYDEITAWLSKKDNNYGLLNGIVRGLDDDTSNQELIKLYNHNFPETFRSRNHLCFEFTNGNQEKIIFYDKVGKHCGELQGAGQQIVGAGSKHPLGEIYSVVKDTPIAKIDYDKFCDLFKNYIPNKIKNVVREFKKTTWEGERITDIPITNIISLVGMVDVGGGCYQGEHPEHGSTTGMNFRVDTLNNTWVCFRCNSGRGTGGGGGSAELIAVMEGIINCGDANKNCFTESKGQEVIKVAREKYGLKAPETNITQLEPMGWAKSINIKKLAEKKQMLRCSKCSEAFQFNERLGWYKCSCSKGGIKKFMALCLQEVEK